MTESSIPMVSVFVLAYNHGKYIAQTLDGILMQNVTFDYDIVVGEDCSTDNTRSILLSYAEKHPQRFKLILHEKNVGGLQNVISTLGACRGKYVAFCEGDDYWTDPNKLQKQVDFLEANPAFSFAFHDCLILRQESGKTHRRIGERSIDTVVDLKSALIENNMPTASMVCRNILDVNELPQWFLHTSKGDYGFVVLLAERGLGKYFPEAMSVYRIHGGGVWSSKSTDYTYAEAVKFFSFLLEYFEDPELKKVIEAKLNLLRFNYSLERLGRGDMMGSLKAIGRNLSFSRDKRLQPRYGRVPRAVGAGVKSLILDRFGGERRGG